VVSAITTCPTNTAFASSTTGASVIAACTDTIDQTFYHNGSGTLPTSGDNAYSDAGGTTPLSAGFYKLNVTSYIEITGSAGLVSGPSSFVLGTSFSSSTSQASGTDACAASLTTTFYHNGSGTLPVASDTCYTDACKTITLSDGLYKITTTNGGSYITITGGSGVVASVTNCNTCTSYPSSNPLSFGAICNPGATPSIDNMYYHNGSGTYPVTGDTVYTTVGCSNPLNGGNSYFYIYSVGTNNFYIRVNSSGVVILDSSCTPP